MSQLDMKLEQNVFYQARKKAAEGNERLNSREGAAELLGYSSNKMLAEWELGNKIPSPESVNLMADLYSAPELRPYFCKHLCPLGCDWPVIDPRAVDNIEKITVSALNTMEKVNNVKLKLLEIADDGKITADEHDTLLIIIRALKDMETVSQRLQMWMKRNG